MAAARRRLACTATTRIGRSQSHRRSRPTARTCVRPLISSRQCPPASGPDRDPGCDQLLAEAVRCAARVGRYTEARERSQLAALITFTRRARLVLRLVIRCPWREPFRRDSIGTQSVTSPCCATRATTTPMRSGWHCVKLPPGAAGGARSGSNLRRPPRTPKISRRRSESAPRWTRSPRLGLGPNVVRGEVFRLRAPRRAQDSERRGTHFAVIVQAKRAARPQHGSRLAHVPFCATALLSSHHRGRR